MVNNQQGVPYSVADLVKLKCKINISMYLIPEPIRSELSNALIHADYNRTFEIMSRSGIGTNSILDPRDNVSILHESVNVLGPFRGSQAQVAIIEFLLAHNADPNAMTTSGYNCLHLALEYHELSSIALVLIKYANTDVHATDVNGNNPIFTAIREYGKTWRPEQKEVNTLRFQIIEELLKRGADLDKVNKHGISSRKWLEISNDEKLHEIVARFDSDRK